MARHANPTARRTLTALATAGVALGAGAGVAAADTEPVVGMVGVPTSLGNIDPQAGAQALTGSVGYVTGPVAGFKPNPLAGTGADPLDNGVALGDSQPIASRALLAPVAQAPSIGSMPVVGQVVGLPAN
jgi:opacity protein-like surface antigen